MTVRGFLAFRRPFVPVLLYHALSEDQAVRHDYVVHRAAFERQMRWLIRRGYRFVSCSALPPYGERVAGRLVAVTFDDGFASVYEHASPVLRELGVPVTLFVSTDFIASGRPFPWPYAAGDPPLTVAQLPELAAVGFEIGAHSCSHSDLRSLGDGALVHELHEPREVIHGWTGSMAATLAYPFGFVDRRVKRAAATAGYTAAFGVYMEPETADRFSVPRILVRNQTSMLGFALRVWGVHPYVKTRRWFRLVRPLLRRYRWVFW